jgi:hypothetical protein
MMNFDGDIAATALTAPGQCEVGFVRALFEHFVKRIDFDQHGVSSSPSKRLEKSPILPILSNNRQWLPVFMRTEINFRSFALFQSNYCAVGPQKPTRKPALCLCV